MIKEAWQNFLKGDELSFTKIYHAYFNELFAYALKIGFDEETSKDAIQDVFFTVYTSKKKLCHIEHIEYYLLHCLKNRLFDIYNKDQKIKHINLIEMAIEQDGSFVEQMIKDESDKEMQHSLSLLLNTLSPKQRKIINYHYYLHLSFAEISEIVNISPEAVKKSIYRSINILKKTINRKF